MKNKKFIFLLILISGLLIFLFSCKSREQIAVKEKPINSKSLYKELLNQDNKISKFIVKKLKIKYESADKHFNVNGTLVILKDSIINIKISPIFGIQAYDLLLTKDSIKLIDRIKRNYYKGSIEEAQIILKHDFNFDDLQSIFLDNLLLFDNLNDISIVNRKTQLFNGLHLIEINEYPDSYKDELTRKYYINNKKKRIEQFQIDMNEKQINVLYKKYLNQNEIAIPQEIILKIFNKTEIINIYLFYNKIQINKEINFTIKEPKNFTLKSINHL